MNSIPDPMETASVEQVKQLQLQRMQWSVQHAWQQVPHFRKRCDALGVGPDDLQSLDDIARFPLTTKDDLRQTYPFGMTAVPMEDVVRIHASSGTTGKSTVVTYTRQDIDNWAALVARSIRVSGGSHKDILHVSYGYGLFTGGLGAHYGGEQLGCAVVPMGGGQTAKQVQLIQDFQPRIIMVTPSYLLNIIDEMEAQGIDPKRSSLEVGILGAEPWSESMRQEIEDRLGIQALDIYGLSEVGGPGVANECVDSKAGPTIWEDHYYPEIIDPDTGEVLPEGEPGELVITTLTREAMPLIRYRTRDLTRLLPPTGWPMRRMARITGRSDDMLIIRGVNLFPAHVEQIVLGIEGLSPHYQLKVERADRLDTLSVLVESRESLAGPDRESLAASLAAAIKTRIGVSASVDVMPPGSVERSQGKAKRVVDLRKFD